ncbi:hypothetical protein E5N58_08790, partial [Campylobacter coli]|nr:hypothetical protein [Campylobacter coli]
MVVTAYPPLTSFISSRLSSFTPGLVSLKAPFVSLAKKSPAKAELVSKEVKANKAKIFFIENPFINSFCKFFK